MDRGIDLLKALNMGILIRKTWGTPLPTKCLSQGPDPLNSLGATDHLRARQEHGFLVDIPLTKFGLATIKLVQNTATPVLAVEERALLHQAGVDRRAV